MNNNSLREIADKIIEVDQILLFPHVNMDGDALGSAAALCKGLRLLGKKCSVLIEDEIPGYLMFLDKGYCIENADKIKSPDLCICVDCAEISRFKKRKEKFMQGKSSMCIDHHITSDPFCDYNYIDGNAAATAEIVFKLLKELNVQMDKEIGEALWAGITTDTGNFQYSNTTKETHEIVVQLYDLNIDHNDISVKIYENVRPEKMLMTNKVMDNIRFFAGGKAAITYVTLDMLKETGAKADETEGIVEKLRCIAGVEIAAFLKEDAEERIKVSMRSKSYANVAEIAMRFNGGGHTKAAGCTINADMPFALKMMVNEIEITLKEACEKARQENKRL